MEARLLPTYVGIRRAKAEEAAVREADSMVSRAAGVEEAVQGLW